MATLSFHVSAWILRKPGASLFLGYWYLGHKSTGWNGFVLCAYQFHFPGLALFLLFPNNPGFCLMFSTFKPYIYKTVSAFCYPRTSLSSPEVWTGLFILLSGVVGLSLVYHYHFIYLSLAPTPLFSYHATMVSYGVK